MCEFCQVFKNSMPEYQQWMNGINVPGDNFFRNVIHCVEPSVCPFCGTRLSYEDMHPLDAACTRSLCNKCYHEIFASHVNEYCPVCGLKLPYNKVQSQMNNLKGTREIRNHLHEECFSKWALMHANVVGVPPEARQVLNGLRSLYMPESSNRKALNAANTDIFTFEQLFGREQKNDGDVVYIRLPGNRSQTF